MEGRLPAMSGNPEIIYSASGKRTVLVADDEIINREILGVILGSEYDLLFAQDGQAAFDLLQENRDTLSLVLLDLNMPRMTGQELLRRKKADPLLQSIPVIVLTTDQEAEVESLRLGAIDFIPKPYPKPDVILARVQRTIELSEDRHLIRATEYDHLTGLYNREYFYSYAEQIDLHHKGTDMDAMVIDVNHFHLINERCGKAWGDGLLQRIAARLRAAVRPQGGIVCRRGADTFLVYCPHREDYEAVLDAASQDLTGAEDAAAFRVRLRMGVYSRVDKALEMERRFDRAKLAADTVRNNYSRSIAMYDDALHQSELYAAQLTDDFYEAIAQNQFLVYYQPKFDVRGDTPLLSSAEALVRWQHPKLGLISPGKFIPLFEENGMISALNHYVWRAAATQIRDWKERFGIVVPVSVNVSRTDTLNDQLPDIISGIVEEFGVAPGDYMLEITESAYTDDSDHIIATVKALRARGFRIEMDDFGTGYSSLAMLSKLPLDVIKLDMTFVRNAYGETRDVRMLELILGIAGHLGVPVVAEGVETAEQAEGLKALGCEIIQGFYFSRPLPPDQFDRLIAERVRVHSEAPSVFGKKSAPAPFF